MAPQHHRQHTISLPPPYMPSAEKSPAYTTTQQTTIRLSSSSCLDDHTSPTTPLLPHSQPSTPVTPQSLRSHQPCCESHHHSQRPPQRRLWPFLIHIPLLSISLILLLAAFYSPHPPTTSVCLTLTTAYSPALPAITHKLIQFKPNVSSSPYVGPTKQVDLHWGRVNFGDQMITGSEMSLLHKSTSDALMVTDPTTGKRGYRIGLEVFHQLHCLNMIRKATYPSYQDEYSGGDFGVDPKQLRGHLDHCVEMLREGLMCQADVGVITFKMQKEGEEAEGEYRPDFANWHVCRDYEAIREWAVGRVVATDVV